METTNLMIGAVLEAFPLTFYSFTQTSNPLLTLTPHSPHTHPKKERKKQDLKDPQ